MSDIRPRITAYCLSWHVTSSSAFTELLVKPLAPYADIRFSAWTGKNDIPPATGDLTIFCQMPPTEAWLAECVTPIVWIPMADALYYPPNMAHHPMVRVVAFSNVIVHVAGELGLPVLQLRCYCDPAQFPVASFDGERVMLYWNRTGFFHRGFLLKLCHELGVNRLLFRSALDPNIQQSKFYALPDKIGAMVIETHPTLTSYDDYLALLYRANIFIAPRGVEGVGVALLEAMASGCCVIGYDNTTMNEYILHNQNGFLVYIYRRNRIFIRLYALYERFFTQVYAPYIQRRTGREVHPPKLTMLQDWRQLRKLDIAKLGAQARQSSLDGYTQWIDSIPHYAEFVLKGILP